MSRRPLSQPKRPTQREALLWILRPKCQSWLDARSLAARAVGLEGEPATLRTTAEIIAYKDMMDIQTLAQGTSPPKPAPLDPPSIPTGAFKFPPA